MHAGFWWGNMREREPLEDPGIDGKILKRNFRMFEGGHGQCWSGSE